jgi:UDP-GlcNAc:undecaprenyl-phosphate/decaprenyl-phosphate GlcNAc-1-phosphate transferase
LRVTLDLIGGAAIAALISIIACRALMAAGPIDEPTLARHAHRAPTPTSGGIGMALGFAAGLMALALFSGALRDASAYGVSLLTVSASFAYAFLILGFWDDAHPLSAKPKFAIFSLLSIGAVFAIGPVRNFPVGEASFIAPVWLAIAGTALWVFVVVNAVNFMDGANGLAMGSVAIGMLALASVALPAGAISAGAAALCAAGALAGFLIWNFPHGKLFAGDSGALFAGALSALLSILVIHRIGLSPAVPAILFFPLIADALLTLAWRAIRRRSLLDGHSEHIYQIVMHAGVSHAEIALVYWAAMAGCGVLGFLAARDPGVAPWVTLGGLVILAVIVSAVVRRFAGRRGVEGV